MRCGGGFQERKMIYELQITDIEKLITNINRLLFSGAGLFWPFPLPGLLN
jgi:hypothetical protein